MTPLHELLPHIDGDDLIRKCWGYVPCFEGPFELIHIRQSRSHGTEILLTGLFTTNEFSDFNQCKPSKLVIQFSDVDYWEYDEGFAEKNGIRLPSELTATPVGYTAIKAGGFYVLCKKITVLNCEHQPFTDWSKGAQI